ncbi:MAG TPA: pyridoxamine 5'-phosphate oxidase family protein [Candidatus Paceibacterota bacterium]
MNKTDAEMKEIALNYLKTNELGALATKSPEGKPRVRQVYYACTDDFSVYFLSLANTRKVSDIRANEEAAFVVTGSDKRHALQIEGVFEEITDTATFGPIITSLTSHLYPEGEPTAPVAHLDNAKPVCFKLKPTWVRYADFDAGLGSTSVFTEISL